jgi:tetratricopeptide (TPR) repeat protein
MNALSAEGAALHAQGRALIGQGRPDQALASFDAVLALAPGLAAAHYDRGVALAMLERPAEALLSFEAAIAINPRVAVAHASRGLALSSLLRRDEALASFETAIILDRKVWSAHSGRGMVLGQLERFEEALPCLDRAIALNPADVTAHSNRGISLLRLKRLDEALRSFEAALRLAPAHVEARLYRAIILLLQGKLAEGWRDFELRKVFWKTEPPAFDQGRSWLADAPLEGQTIFIYPEQGLGDTIQFSRYAPLLEEAGAHVVLSVARPLQPLLRQVLARGEVIGEGERPVRFDYHCSLMSLPLALKTTLESLPPLKPLAADGERRRRLEAMLGPKRRPRVGLVWSGNPAHENDRQRSVPLEQLLPILTDDIEWICLQKELRPDDAASLAGSGKVAFFGGQISDFADTAALVDLTDLVISVDTSVAHLAGAMGKPIWVLLNFVPDWRWLLDRTDSPWYPSARLFRQPALRDWGSVIEELGAALAAWSKSGGQRG